MQFFEQGPLLRPVSFVIEASADDGLLPRLLAPFSRRGLCPDRVQMRRHGVTMRVDITLDAIPAGLISSLEGNLRQIIGIVRITVVLRAAVERAA